VCAFERERERDQVSIKHAEKMFVSSVGSKRKKKRKNKERERQRDRQTE
jgi:hypothetical protein